VPLFLSPLQLDMNCIDMNGVSLGDHGERLGQMCTDNLSDDAMSAAFLLHLETEKSQEKSSFDFVLRLFEFLEVKLPDHSKWNRTNPRFRNAKYFA
jgi:hypothetical protein